MLSVPVDYEKGETPMTDFQFTCYKEERDQREALQQENTRLRDENEALRQLVKSHVQAGKSPEEILAAVEALKLSN